MSFSHRHVIIGIVVPLFSWIEKLIPSLVLLVRPTENLLQNLLFFFGSVFKRSILYQKFFLFSTSIIHKIQISKWIDFFWRQQQQKHLEKNSPNIFGRIFLRVYVLFCLYMAKGKFKMGNKMTIFRHFRRSTDDKT